jgi:hypothetical protein
MSRDELVTYLLAKADAFEGHPAHVDMSAALREAAEDIECLAEILREDETYDATTGIRAELEAAIMCIDPDATPFMQMITAATTPDTQRPAPGLQSNASRNRDPGADQQ